jgi:hypothetical protein
MSIIVNSKETDQLPQIERKRGEFIEQIQYFLLYRPRTHDVQRVLVGQIDDFRHMPPD